MCVVVTPEALPLGLGDCPEESMQVRDATNGAIRCLFSWSIICLCNVDI